MVKKFSINIEQTNPKNLLSFSSDLHDIITKLADKKGKKTEVIIYLSKQKPLNDIEKLKEQRSYNLWKTWTEYKEIRKKRKKVAVDYEYNARLSLSVWLIGWKKLNVKFEFGEVKSKPKEQPKKQNQSKFVPIPQTNTQSWSHKYIVNFLSQQLKWPFVYFDKCSEVINKFGSAKFVCLWHDPFEEKMPPNLSLKQRDWWEPTPLIYNPKKTPQFNCAYCGFKAFNLDEVYYQFEKLKAKLWNLNFNKTQEQTSEELKRLLNNFKPKKEEFIQEPQFKPSEKGGTLPKHLIKEDNKMNNSQLSHSQASNVDHFKLEEQMERLSQKLKSCEN